MIRVNSISSHNFKEAEEFLINNCCKSISLTNKVVLAMMEDTQIIGISVFYLNKGQAHLDGLVILENRRGEYLGDSLLRASLNYILQKGVKYCVYNNRQEREFFIKSGFAPMCEESDNNQGFEEGLIIDIERFFSKRCTSKG